MEALRILRGSKTKISKASSVRLRYKDVELGIFLVRQIKEGLQDNLLP
jgi:hypothetical protein